MRFKPTKDYFRDWSLVTGNLYKKFPELQANDLSYTEGNEEETLNRIQQRLNIDRETLLRHLEEIRNK
ncbi:MAG: hypothetical protein ACOC0C_08880 [Bacteroidota bacterium]